MFVFSLSSTVPSVLVCQDYQESKAMVTEEMVTMLHQFQMGFRDRVKRRRGECTSEYVLICLVSWLTTL